MLQFACKQCEKWLCRISLVFWLFVHRFGTLNLYVYHDDFILPNPVTPWVAIDMLEESGDRVISLLVLLDSVSIIHNEMWDKRMILRNFLIFVYVQ